MAFISAAMVAVRQGDQVGRPRVQAPLGLIEAGLKGLEPEVAVADQAVPPLQALAVPGGFLVGAAAEAVPVVAA